METPRKNPKALNLEAVKLSHAKVTVGFKCYPKIKLDLAQNALELGLTLSEYVENLIMNHEKITSQENEKLTATIKDLSEKIAFYENDRIKKLFKQYKNQTVEYKNSSEEDVKLKIVDLKDVYTVIVNSFKIKETND